MIKESNNFLIAPNDYFETYPGKALFTVKCAEKTKKCKLIFERVY